MYTEQLMICVHVHNTSRKYTHTIISTSIYLTKRRYLGVIWKPRSQAGLEGYQVREASKQGRKARRFRIGGGVRLAGYMMLGKMIAG